MNLRERVVRYPLLLIALFIMASGVSLSIKANLGTSPISCVPYVLSLIGPFTVGEFTIIFNLFLILLQILILRSDFDLKQLLQIFVIIPFGYFTDFTLYLLSNITVNGYIFEWITCLLGCIVLAFGIFIEIKAGLLYMPGEGIVIALSKVTKIEFGKIKPIFDMSMVISAVILSFAFLGKLMGAREGTIIAAILIGLIVKFYKDTIGLKVDKIINNLISGN